MHAQPRARNSTLRHSLSQAGQDQAVLDVLGNLAGGFFVDLAANDPFLFSNTAALEAERGWRGLCVDAAERSQRTFVSSNRTCAFLRALVGQPHANATLLFRELEPLPTAGPRSSWMHGLSSVVASETAHTCWDRFCISVRDLQRRNVSVMHERMRQRSLDDVLDEAHAPDVISYLSLDVEGHESAVLRGLRRHRVLVATVERPDAAACALLAARGMRYARSLGEFGETLWVHRDEARYWREAAGGESGDGTRDRER